LYFYVLTYAQWLDRFTIYAATDYYVQTQALLIDQTVVFLMNEKKIQFDRFCILSVMFSSVPKQKVELPVALETAAVGFSHLL
jgi:hypothetical protein